MKLPAVLALGVVALACSESVTEPEPEPVVESIAAAAAPAIPSDLKVSCKEGPDTVQPGSTCPVIRWLGHTYWAYSHADNRLAMTVIAYDNAGTAVMQWEKEGARYLWAITVDTAARTVTFRGQSDNTITMGWEELRIAGG